MLARELAHVAPQETDDDRSEACSIRLRTRRRIQCQFDPNAFAEEFCGPDEVPVRLPSSGVIGTAYGKWLGLDPVVGQDAPQSILSGGQLGFLGWRGVSASPEVACPVRIGDVGLLGVSANSPGRDRTLRWPRRTDILDAGTLEVYEIKPFWSVMKV